MARETIRNKITSNEIIEQINPKNKELIEQFLKTKGIKVSEKTIGVYKSNLNIFSCWNFLHNNNKFFIEIKKIEFSNFFSFCSNELGLGSARINNLRSTLSSFSIFIERFYDEEYPDFRNVILTIIDSAPPEERREKTILEDEQIEDLLDHLSKDKKQEALWVALASYSGSRFSELLRFEIDHIDKETTAFGGIFLKTTRKIQAKGRGKNGKMIFKYILKDKFLPYYEAWLEEREKILKEKGLEHSFLFIKQDGQPATDATVRGWIDYFTEYCGVPIYPHAFRHFLTTLLSKKNIPHNLIQALFSWESSDMINIYDDSSISDKEFPELENLRD